MWHASDHAFDRVATRIDTASDHLTANTRTRPDINTGAVPPELILPSSSRCPAASREFVGHESTVRSVCSVCNTLDRIFRISVLVLQHVFVLLEGVVACASGRRLGGV